MKAGVVWDFSVATSRQAEEAIGDLLQTVFRTPASSYTEIESGLVTVHVYLSKNPGDSQARVTAGLELLKTGGLNIHPGKISIQKLPKRDWAESWKKHFQPIEIGHALLIKPSWSRRKPRPGQRMIILDPGLSFGTGQHPTTRFCLEQIVSSHRTREPQSLLDIGTGSGILAIAAAALGYQPVVALDSDSEAIRAARANIRQNRLTARIRLQQADLRELPSSPKKKYSFVCANLIATLLLEHRERLIAQSRPGGVLVLAGILQSEFRAIRTAYEAAGLKLITMFAEDEWQSAAFS